MRVFGIERKILFFSFLGVFLSSLAVQAANINPNHDSPQAQAGDCMYCHVSENTGPTLPKQAACLKCHVWWNAATTSLEVVGFQQEYGMPPMEMLMHEIFSNSGEEIKIYDFAVCFSCHSDPAKATVITPYHGAKVNGSIWSDNLEDPTDDPYAMFYYHPGRNTFNAMSYVFNNRNGNWNQKLLDGHDSLTNCAGQTAKDLGKSEDNACVPVPKYRDLKGDAWEFPVPGYELRVTIPFDNFGVDPSPTVIDVPYFPEIPPPSSACPDTDADGWAVCDGSCDETDLTCGDVCPDDPAKTDDAGQCGCGVAETDTDADGIADCVDACPNDPDNDVDSDGVCGDVDVCPNDPAKSVDAGQCGCGNAESDSDMDGIADCVDACPNDPGNDIDSDGVCGDVDVCPNDPDNDIDSDGVCGDVDVCPADPAKSVDSGQCGCGNAETDTDTDGIADCVDVCPNDPTNNCQTTSCADYGDKGTCVGDLACEWVGKPKSGFCQDTVPAEVCDDTIDNDGDGLADCDDPDCAGVGSCPAPATCSDHNGDEASCLADGCRWNSRKQSCR